MQTLTHGFIFSRVMLCVSAAGLLLLFSMFPSQARADMDYEWRFNCGGPIYSSPALGADGTIYVGSDNNTLFAVNPNGTLKWTFKGQDKVRSSPAVGADGTVYVTDDSDAYALNPDGTMKWRLFFYGGGGSPAIRPDGYILIQSHHPQLHVLNSFGVGGTPYNIPGLLIEGASPTVSSDGTMYVYGSISLQALPLNLFVKWELGFIRKPPAIGPDGILYVGSGNYISAVNPDGTVKWLSDRMGGDLSGVVIGPDGNIYVGRTTGYLYSLSRDGDRNWRATFGDKLGTPAVSANGIVYVGYENGLYAVNPDGSLKSKSSFPGEFHNSAPVISSNGTVYIGASDGYLYAVKGVSQGGAVGFWSMYRGDASRTGRQYAGPSGTISVSSTQDADVTLNLVQANSVAETGDQLRAAYQNVTEFTPQGGVRSMTLGVYPAGSNATLYFSETGLEGTVAELELMLLSSKATRLFKRCTNNQSDSAQEGDWWITKAGDAEELQPDAVLAPSASYRIYYKIKDNGPYDFNASSGYITGKVALGRYPVATSPDISNSVRACVCGGTTRNVDSNTLVVTYGEAGSDILPVSDMMSFNATVSPAGSLAVFRFNSTKLSGSIGNMTLRKFFPATLKAVDYGAYHDSGNATEEGDWWITFRNNTLLNKTASLTLGTNYYISFAVKDDGVYDADPTPGRITDPLLLGLEQAKAPAPASSTGSGTSGSSSKSAASSAGSVAGSGSGSVSSSGSGGGTGCMLNPSAGFGLEWLMVALCPLLAAMRSRFRK